MPSGARLSRAAPRRQRSCLTRCYFAQPQLGGHSQTSQPHALPQQQRAASARSAVWQVAQAQVVAAQGAQEQELFMALVMGFLGGVVVASRRPGDPGTGPRDRGRRSSYASR
jgi:hypothetical protein